MLVLAIAVAVALILPAVTGGSYTRLIMTGWRWSPLLFAGLGLQLVLEFDTIPKSRWDDVGFGLLLLSYGLIIVFCARNLLLKGMVIVLIGVCCNTLVIAFDHGMPVHLPPDLAKEQAFEPTVKHHPQDASDRLTVLGDRIVLRSPFDTALSFGDLIIAVGLCDVTYHASRRRKPRHATPRVRTESGPPEPTIDLSDTIDLTEFEPARPPLPRRQPTAVFASPTARSSALNTRSS